MRRSLELGTTAFRENTALTDEASKFYARLTGRLVTLRNKISNVAAEFGDTLRPAIDAAIGAVSRALEFARNLITAFGNLSEKTRKTAVAVVALVAVLGPLAFVVGVVITLFGSVIAIMSGVVIALGVVGGVILGIKQNWFGMGDVAIKVWDGILSVVETVVSAIGPVVRNLINFLVGLFVGLGGVVAVVATEMTTKIKGAFKDMEPGATRFFAGVVRGFARLGALVSKVARKMIADFRFIFEIGIEESEPVVKAAAEGLGSKAAQAFLGAFGRDYVGAFFAIVKEGIDRARVAIAGVLERLRGLLGAANISVQLLEQALVDLGNIPIPGPGDIPDGLKSAGDAAQRLADIVGSEVGNSFRDVLQGIDSLGSAIVELGKSILINIVGTLVRAVAQALVLKAVMSAFGLGGGGGFGGILKGILGFKHGGEVPGRGPVPAILHGGEFVMTRSMLQDLQGLTSSGAGHVPATAPTAAGQGATGTIVSPNLSRIPATVTPREVALDSAWQEVLRETLLQLEQGGFRLA